MNDIVGKKYVFPDGNSIEVMQVKDRDEGEQLVTYHITVGPSIPQKLVMTMNEFITTFGHLFRPSQ